MAIRRPHDQSKSRLFRSPACSSVPPLLRQNRGDSPSSSTHRLVADKLHSSPQCLWLVVLEGRWSAPATVPYGLAPAAALTLAQDRVVSSQGRLTACAGQKIHLLFLSLITVQITLCVRVYASGSAGLSAVVRAEVRGQPPALLLTFHLETGSAFCCSLGTTGWPSHGLPESPFSTSCLAVIIVALVPHLDFKWVQGIRTQYPRLAWQALCPLSHLRHQLHSPFKILS